MDSSFFLVFVSTVICFFTLSTCKSCLVSPKEDLKQCTQPPQHQVFINFRGEELRFGFVSHLVEALENNNIKVFIDNYADKGEPLETLFTKIKESRIALAILSMKYTESTWCLRELAKIKDCVKNGKLVAIPIFYKLEPSTIRGLRGQFGDSFRDLKECDVTKKEEWRKALKWITNLFGIAVHEKSPESIILNQIVMEVKKALKKVPSQNIVDDQVSSTTGNLMKLSKKYVDYAGGNTRALEELGKELCGEDEAHWETRLATLPHCCNPKEAEIVQAEAKSRRDDNFLGEANSDVTFNFENKRFVQEGVEGERDGILWDKKSDRNPKEAGIVQAEARDRYTEFSTGSYGAKPGCSSDAKTNIDLLDSTC